MMLTNTNLHSLPDPDVTGQAQWMPGEDVPSEVLLDSTLRASKSDEPEQVDHRRLRNLVHERVFGAAPDTLKIDRYVILERIGSGGMGVVFSAYDQELDRKVAIKLLHHGANPAHHARLLREAQALARLSHPNVVQVHDVGETGGQVFVAMEFVAGKTLREWTRERPRNIREIIDAYVQAGRGLEAAHEAGIVHRDFKPDNVLIGDDGRVRVLDFGIARAEQGEVLEGQEPEPNADPTVPLTRTGMIVGTPAYMAPEQHLGQAADMRSDQFAFCVALHESLHRTRPFAGDSYKELVENVITGRRRAIESAASTPRWLRELLARGLAAEPEQRFPDLSALLRELSRDRLTVRVRLAIAATTLALASVAGYYIVALQQEHEDKSAALAGEIESESQRADEAERELRRREDAVTIAEASLLMPDSPVDALAKLDELHEDHDVAGAAWIIASDARERGIPSSISHWPEHLSVIRVSASGRRAVLIDAQSHELHVFDVLRNETTATQLVVEHGVIKISDDGRFVAVRASDDENAIDVWDADARSTTRIATSIEGTIDDLYVERGGERFVACVGKRGWLFDRERASREIPEGMCAVDFVPGSEDLLLTDPAGVLRRFDPNTGALSVLLRGIAFNVEVSPNGQWVAAVTRDWTDHKVLVAALDGSDAREPKSFQFEGFQESTIYTFAWHPNSNALALGSSEGFVLVVGLDGGDPVELPRHHRQLQKLAFSPDGSLLATASSGGSVYISRLSNGHAEAQPGHRSMGWVVFDDEGKLRTVDWEGMLRVWEPAPRHRVSPGPAFRPDYLDWSSKNLLAVASPWELSVVTVDDGEVLWKTAEHAPYEGLAWSGDGERLVSAHGDGLRVWTHTGTLERTVDTKGGQGGEVYWLDDRIAWGEGGVGVHLLNPTSDERELIPIPSASKIVAFDSDPHRNLLWVGSWNGTNIGSISGFEQGTWVRTADHHLGADGLMDIAVIPGRDELVYGTFFGDVYLLDIESGERRRLGIHDDQVNTVEVDALGRTLYTGSWDGSARVWDLATGRWREVRGDTQRVWSLALSPDGTSFATGQSAGKLMIWRDDLPREWNELRAWIDQAKPARP